MKKFLAIALVLVMMFSLAACGSSDKKDETEAPKTETEAPASETAAPDDQSETAALETDAPETKADSDAVYKVGMVCIG
ncbi:MAG: BMP family ABC transporter substrate-binding protein, partial [Lachnospiraceae bacterium]|nr:BMP family ABC transporter substrate-binding protein [Lachnospiraceae bacterium]